MLDQTSIPDTVFANGLWIDVYKRQLMESTLAQAYKTKINGEYIGGPALFIERGLKIKPYAVLFALATILGPGILMQGLHANSVASTFQRSFGTGMITGGVILCVDVYKRQVFFLCYIYGECFSILKIWRKCRLS